MRESNDVHGYMTYEINNFLKKLYLSIFSRCGQHFSVI